MKAGLCLLLISALLSACGGGGGGASTGSGVSPSQNTAPAFVSQSFATLLEGQKFVIDVLVDDVENDAVTLNLSGSDSGLFSLSGNTLSFIAAADFEVPNSVLGTNVYSLTLSASDGRASATQAFTVTVTDATEGRVIDGPLSAARVFVDTDGDLLQGANEPSVVTDASGFFRLPLTTTGEGNNSKLVSIGGTDTSTSKLLANLVLVSDLPSSSATPVIVSPLSLVVSTASTPAAKQSLLNLLGITGMVEEMLAKDFWALAEDGNLDARYMQTVNQAIGIILQSATSLIETSETTSTVNAVDITSSYAAQIASQLLAGKDVFSSAVIAAVLEKTVEEYALANEFNLTVDTEVFTAVARSIATVIVVLQGVENPTSEVAESIAGMVQNNLQPAITAVALSADIDNFAIKSTPGNLFAEASPAVLAIVNLDSDGDGIINTADEDLDNDGAANDVDRFPFDSAESLDTDNDGVGDNADRDDDGDGVADTADALPLDSSEILDTDDDGIGNNADNDDDNDGVVDSADGFPLISIGDRTDTDGDGRPDECDGACIDEGLAADDDDDGDGVADTADAFPLDPSETLDSDIDGIGDNADAFPFDGSESVDTDDDGIGNNADNDDDNDGVVDERDPASLDKSLTPPTAVIATDLTLGNAPLRVVFDANSSIAGNLEDGADEITSITWNSGDMTTGNGSVFEHIYLAAGEYTVSVTVVNSDGYSDTATHLITVSEVQGTLEVAGAISIPNAYIIDSDVNDQSSTPVSNNSLSQPQLIWRSAVVSGYVNQPGSGEDGLSKVDGDVYDIYRINALGGEVINLISGDTDSGDLDLFITNSDFSYSDWSVGDSTLYESITLPAGEDTYYIEVSAWSGASTYVLEIGGQKSMASHGWNAGAEFVENELIVQENLSSKARNAIQTRQALGVSKIVRSKSSKYTGPVLYRLNPSAIQAASSRVKQSGLKPFNSSANRSKLETLQMAKKMRALEQFNYVEPNFIHKASAVPNDSAYGFQAWHYEQINMPEAWDRSSGMGNVKVAVLDTGVMLNHSDLATRTTSDGYDFIISQTNSGDGDGPDSDPSDPGDGRDNPLCPNSRDYISSFHGTHVAGTVGASGNDNVGVTGVNWNVNIMPIRVLGCNGGNDYEISQGILYAAGLANDFDVLPNSPADIINLSLGSDYASRISREAISAARETGVIVIAAAGNSALSGNPISYPASYPGVISVGATNPEGRRAAYSQYNDAIDIAAPGGYSSTNEKFSSAGVVVSTYASIVDGLITPSIAGLIGTSMAAPHVAGVASLMKGIYPNFTPDDFDLALSLGLMTVDLGTTGNDVEYGYGLIDANKSLQAAESLVSGVSSDFPPLLHLSTYEVNLGVTGTQIMIEATNAGGGSLIVNQVVSSANNISVVSSADSDGLGDYTVTIDRAGLAVGVYQSFVQFASNAGIRTLTINYEELPSNAGDPDAGGIYTLLYNVNTEIVERQDSSVASAGQYSFSIDQVNPAVYILVSGSDIDNDGFICGAGEACGYWPNVQDPDYLIANQSFADLTMGIIYQTQIQVDTNALSSSPTGVKKVDSQVDCQNEANVTRSPKIGLSICAKNMLRRLTSKRLESIN